MEVDEERTAPLYQPYWPPLDWCQCDGCTNARMCRIDGSPTEQIQVLEALDMDPRIPYSTSSVRQFRPKSRHHTHRVSCWPAYGKIVGFESTPKRRFDRHNSMWVDSRLKMVKAAIESPMQPLPEGPDLIYIIASNRLLWLYGEVCGFRSDYVLRACPTCRGEWRETGYLKRHSFIPDWKHLPELKEVLRRGRQRVYVEFCSKCGRMDYQIVEAKPPFRTKSHLYRDKLRALESGTYRYSLLQTDQDSGSL